MGGATLIEVKRVGCDVWGLDINPMSAWIVREEIEHIDLTVYERAARALIAALRAEIDRYYRTTCQRGLSSSNTVRVVHHRAVVEQCRPPHRIRAGS